MRRPKATTTHGKLPDFLRITMSRRQGRPEAGRGIWRFEAFQETKDLCAISASGRPESSQNVDSLEKAFVEHEQMLTQSKNMGKQENIKHQKKPEEIQKT